MILTVISDDPVDKQTETIIRTVMAKSECPNESLINSIGARYHPNTKDIVIGNPVNPKETHLMNVEVKR